MRSIDTLAGPISDACITVPNATLDDVPGKLAALIRL
jgi:hypothetical protein